MKNQIIKIALIVSLLASLSLLARPTHGQQGPPPLPTIGAPASWPSDLYLPIILK